VVGIFVDDDLVGAPIPIAAEAVVCGGDAKGEAAEPEAFAIAAFDAPLMAGAEAAGEAAMFPGMIKVIVGIIVAGAVADPRIVGVNVRSFGMAMLVGVFRGFLRCDVLLRPGRRRAVSRNMAVADIASLWGSTVLSASLLFFLRESGNGTDQEHCENA
jgi:hypothetical protein